MIELLDESYGRATETISDAREALVDCLGKLTDEKKHLVTEYYTPGGAATLAKLLAMTPNALRQSVHRIRRQLTQCVERRLQVAK